MREYSFSLIDDESSKNTAVVRIQWSIHKDQGDDPFANEAKSSGVVKGIVQANNPFVLNMKLMDLMDIIESEIHPDLLAEIANADCDNSTS